nr:hypothetical protein [Tanacetum cinerariifolium]
METKGKNRGGKMQENSYKVMSLALVSANGKPKESIEGVNEKTQEMSPWKVKTALGEEETVQENPKRGG